ncbi:SDR family NAD(P)-dependent oxidoreductase [Nannocystaceae bacterium ST9]
MSNDSSRRILITGASRGIGRAAALDFARRGHRLVLAARDLDRLRALAAEIAALGGRAEVVELDVSSDDSVARAAAEILAVGPLDVLINNAGVFQQRLFLDQDPAWARHEMEVNYFGAQRVARAILPAMLERRSGTLVNVASLLAAVPGATVANYCGTKAALVAWSHALRGEVERQGVRVVVFMPSHTATEAALENTRFDGVYALPVDYTAAQLVRASERAPRSMAASPVFRLFLRLAAVFPGWAERQMNASTRALLPTP